MKKMISRVTLALALLATTVGTTTLQADTLDRVAPQGVASGVEEAPTVRVVNNHRHQVRVYVLDSNNRLRWLGRVGGSKVKDLQIPSGLVRGTVQLKVYPDVPNEGLTMSVSEPAGIKTKVLSVRSDQVIEFYLEPDLLRSFSIVSS